MSDQTEVRKSQLHPEFLPHGSRSYVRKLLCPEGWYIGLSDPKNTGDCWTHLDNGKVVWFTSKADCQRAINSLAEAGIVDDMTIKNLDDVTLLKLCYENLFW